jgi:hypothetical protein
MRPPRPPHELAFLCAVACTLALSLVATALADASPRAPQSRATTRASVAHDSPSQPGRARPLAHTSIRIPTGALRWLGRRAARQIGRQTRHILVDHGKREAINYFCSRWLSSMGTDRNWYYWALRDYRVGRAWRFCATYW